MSDDTSASPAKRGRKSNAEKAAIAEKEKAVETKKRTKKVIDSILSKAINELTKSFIFNSFAKYHFGYIHFCTGYKRNRR